MLRATVRSLHGRPCAAGRGRAGGNFKRPSNSWRRDDGSLIAASMAYYAVLSFFPLLLLLIAVLGFVLQFSPGAQNAQKELLRLLAQNTSPELADHVRTSMQAIQTNAVVGGPVGLATLLVAAIGIFTQIDVAMDRIWNLRTPAVTRRHRRDPPRPVPSIPSVSDAPGRRGRGLGGIHRRHGRLGRASLRGRRDRRQPGLEPRCTPR